MTDFQDRLRGDAEAKARRCAAARADQDTDRGAQGG